MTPEETELENRLRALPPAAVSPALLARLQASRPAAPATVIPFRPWRLLVPLAAAAALAIALTAHFLTPRPTERAVPATEEIASLRPLQNSECIVSARDGGLYRDAAGRAYRVLHCVGVGQRVWQDDVSGQLVAQTFPQEHLVLVGLPTY